MALTQRLDVRLSQTLVMTPQLQQAIKLLQLSNADLTAYVEEELEQNPLLERDEGYEDFSEPDLEADPSPVADDADAATLTHSETIPNEAETPLDTSYDDVWIDDAAPREGWASSAGANGEAGDFNLEQTVGGATTLRDHIVEQIGVDVADPAERLIALYLVEQLDDSGYLGCTVEDAAEDLGAPADRVERVLQKVQAFDPSGIFARNLAECLAIQLREKNRLDPAMQALLDNLELLARRDANTLLRICGVDAEDLADMAAEIRALNPKPAVGFEQNTIQPITPDVLMRADGKGGWAVELNSETLPRVLVNAHYYKLASKRGGKDKSYVTEQLQSANWLVKALHQRATTILKVSAEIVRLQDGFFRHGIAHLRPLVLRDVAEAVEMHESTVSRVTANKYIATPRGVYELKYFFTASIASSSGDPHSAEAVRVRIKSLIAGETVAEVLSDDMIVDILKDDGIEIARRTVAKYRDALRIPSSVQRRREKRSTLAV